MFSFFEHSKKTSKNYSPEPLPKTIKSSLSDNLALLKQKTGKSPDIIIRSLKIGNQPKVKAAVVYVSGIVDTQTINEFLIEVLINYKEKPGNEAGQELIEKIAEEVVSVGSIKTETEWSSLFESLLSGNALIFIDGAAKALTAGTKGGEKRAIQEPSTQSTVRGSREGFTESMETNMAMVRRIIKNPNLWIESIKIGNQTRTDVSIMYINGSAESAVIEEVKKRLKKIKIDSILESGYIEQLIEDQTMSPFPTLYYTERPDIVAGNLLEGRVAVFINGTPFTLLAPAVFVQFFQASDDYYTRFDIATATRFLRAFIFLISLLGPATFVAAITYHHEMIPTTLLIVIAAQRESVPFPAIFEALIMEVTFEILREAGLRLPKAIGSTVSIVGGLVVGQAAVQAGIVSPTMLIIVAITAIASFATPSFAVAISARLLRFAFMICAASLGFYGIMLALFMMVAHLCSLRSFGIPYMAPFAPFMPGNLGDTLVRIPWWSMKKKTQLMNHKNIQESKNKKSQSLKT